jgi:hypothetical protein
MTSDPKPTPSESSVPAGHGSLNRVCSARDAGAKAALSNTPTWLNPHPAGTKEHDEWKEGYTFATIMVLLKS